MAFIFGGKKKNKILEKGKKNKNMVGNRMVEWESASFKNLRSRTETKERKINLDDVKEGCGIKILYT